MKKRSIRKFENTIVIIHESVEAITARLSDQKFRHETTNCLISKLVTPMESFLISHNRFYEL